jgi:autotransporter-associated beta strand protein
MQAIRYSKRFACPLAGLLLLSPSLKADYASEILSDDPLVYYRFNDGATDQPVIADNLGSAGATGDGVYSNSATHLLTGAMPGNSDKSISSSVRSMHIPYTPALNQAGSFTVEGWVRPSSAVAASTAHVMSSVDFASPRSGWVILQSTATSQGFIFRTYNKRGTSVAVNTNTATNLTPGTWYHLVCVYDDATRQGRVYLNGVLKGTWTVSTAGSGGNYYEPPVNQPFTLHTRSDDVGPWSGGLDEVAYYPRALSDAEVLEHYNNGTNPTPSQSYDDLVLSDNPAGYWRLGEAGYTVPPAANLGTLGSGANGVYNGQAYNTDTGPKTGSGFLGFGANNLALSLVSQNGFVGVPLQLLNNRTAFTVTGWVKRGAVKSTRGGYFGQNDLLEFGDAGGGLNIESWIAARGGNMLPGYTFADDEWGFIALSADQNAATLFLNGVQVAQLSGAIGNYGTSGFNFNIGGGGVFNATGDFFRGEIDEVAVFDKALSANRVQQLYDSALGNVAPTAGIPTVSPSTIIPEGQSYTLSITPAGSPPFTYQWKRDGVEISGATDPTLLVGAAVLNDPVNQAFAYTCEVTNAGGNVESDPVDVLVVPTFRWTGADPVNGSFWDLGTTANWEPLSGGGAGVYLDECAVLFDDSAVTTTIELQSDVAPYDIVFENETKDLSVVSSFGGIVDITGITKRGAATTTLLTNNAYNGPTIVDEGVLQVGNGVDGYINATSRVEINGGALRINEIPNGFFTNEALIATGGELVFNGTGNLDLTGAATISGAGMEVFDRDGLVFVNRPNSISQVQILRGEVLFDGSQVGNRLGLAPEVTVEEGAIMTVAGVNCLPTGTNASSITLDGGMLRLLTGGSLATGITGQSHAHLRSLQLNGGTVELAYSGDGSAFDGESGQLTVGISVTGTAPSLVTSAAGTDNGNSGLALVGVIPIAVADVTGDSAPDFIIDGELENNGDGLADGFTKTGAGTLLLGGGRSHSLSGAVTVTEGVLLGDGSMVATLAVGAGGTFSAGETTGEFISNSANIQGTWLHQINGPASDHLQINGNLTIGNGATIAIQAIAPTLPSYVIATYTGTLTQGTNLVTGVPAGYSVDYAFGPSGKQIALVSSSSDPYAAWEEAEEIPAGLRGFDQDADGDGVPNGIEFITQSDPMDGSSSNLPVARLDGDDFVFTYDRRDDAVDLEIVVKTSETLSAPWTAAVDGVDGVEILVEPNGAAPDSVEVRVPRNGRGRLFGRMEAGLGD